MHWLRRIRRAAAAAGRLGRGRAGAGASRLGRIGRAGASAPWVARVRRAVPWPARAPATATACGACGAALVAGQDWCLECGTAQPGRIGARPGLRAALSVGGLTTMLMASAVVAAYAALTGDAERQASAPPAGAGDPIVAQTPGAAGAAPVQPGITGPGVTAPPPQQGPIIPVKPPPATANAPAVPAPGAVVPPPPPAGQAPPFRPPAPPAGGGSDRAPATGGGSSSGGAGAAQAAAPLEFARDAARNYDPYERAGAEFGPPRNAIDGDPKTVWDVVVPADGKPVAAGLVIDLGRPYALRSLRLATPTEGFTLEVYGARSADELPTDVIDKRWIHLTDSKSVEDHGLIYLKGKGDGARVRLLLLYVTKPGDAEDPRAAIGEVTLRGTP